MVRPDWRRCPPLLDGTVAGAYHLPTIECLALATRSTEGSRASIGV
jgi:hypothetical protein